MNIPYVFKRCSKCGEWLVASKVNFYKVKSGKYGLRGDCKKCKNEHYKEYQKEYYQNNKEHYKEYSKEYRKNNKEYYKEYGKEYGKKYYQNNKEHCKEYSKEYRKNNKEYYKEYGKEYRKNNKDKKAEYDKEYRKNNKDKKAEYDKEYRKNNKDNIAKYHKKYYKEYYKTPQGQVILFNSSHKRRLKEENQGNGITKEQWLEMMRYFEFKCAYSDETLTKDTRSIDHIEPLNQGGEHEIWNIVPMYRSYNISKHDKDLLEWYKEQPFFSEDRLQKIYEWQQYAYNKWHKEEIV